MKIRSILASAAVAFMAVGGGVATAGAASAAPPVPTASGHVALAGPVQHPWTGPIQYASFNVFAGRYHGSINYANFNLPAFHTNVWNVTGTHQLVFTVGTSTYKHTMKVTTITPLSTHATQFSGTGHYNAPPFNKWTVSGTVNWNVISFNIAYTGTTYTVSGTGTIKPDGSVSGTATDSNGTKLLFAMPKHSAFQVVSYSAPVKSATIKSHDATFGYTIPKGMPMAGLPIVVKVHDGGPGFRHDTFAMGRFFGPVIQYKITSGDIFVRR
jgi:hypothetical protein